MNKRKMLLINGSPRKKGTSHAILAALQQLAEEKGLEAEAVHAIDFLDGKADMGSLRPVIRESAALCLSAPLYFDALPYPAIWFLERMQEAYPNELKGKALFAISQGGFPDDTLHKPPLEQCRIFAIQNGMNWCGGLAHGGGAIINGTPLSKLGKKGKRMAAGLRMALDAASSGKQMPEEAKKLFSNRVPRWLLPLLGMLLNQMARNTAKKTGSDYLCKPYLDKE